MTIIAPCDAEEMKMLMPLTYQWNGPVYIRLAKGGDPVVSRCDAHYQIGKAILMKEGKDVLLISTGVATQVALESADLIEKEGLTVGVLHMHTLKPLDETILKELARHYSAIISIEEHIIIGGLGGAVSEVLSEARLPSLRFKRIGIGDQFVDKYGSQKDLFSYFGITKEKIAKESQILLQH